jgi:hypothetical protein
MVRKVTDKNDKNATFNINSFYGVFLFASTYIIKKLTQQKNNTNNTCNSN